MYIYIYPRARESQISMVLVSVGLASLAQLKSVHVHFAPGSNGRSFPLEYS